MNPVFAEPGFYGAAHRAWFTALSPVVFLEAAQVDLYASEPNRRLDATTTAGSASVRQRQNENPLPLEREPALKRSALLL